MIFDKHANLKYKYCNRNFWCRGYYVDTVGKNKERIAEYVRHQLQEDIPLDQLSLKQRKDRRICKKSIARRYSVRSVEFERIFRSFRRKYKRQIRAT